MMEMKKALILCGVLFLLCVSAAYALPTVDSVTIATSNSANYTQDNLTAAIVNPSDSYVVDWQWYNGGSLKSVAELLMPFDYSYNSVNTTDFSGNNRLGNISGAVTYNLTAGHGGTPAYDFNGTDGRIDLPVLNMNSYGNVTFSAWINTHDARGNIAIFRQETTVIPPDWLFSFQNDTFGWCTTGKYCLTFGLRTTSGYDELDVNISPADYEGGWHLVTAVYNGTHKMLYRDGVLIGNNTANSGRLSTIGLCDSIGGYKDFGCTGNAEHFNGLIDDAAIYNKALSPMAIKQLLNNRAYVLGANTGVRQEIWQARVIPISATEQGTPVFSNNITLYAAPQYSAFSGNTTNFWATTDARNVSSAVLQKGATKLAWSATVNAENQDFNTNVVMGSGFVSVNAAALHSSINSSATVSVPVSGCDSWKIYYYKGTAASFNTIKALGTLVGSGTTGGGSCTDYCSNPVCSNSLLTYDVPHFDSTGGEGSSAGTIPEFPAWGLLLAVGVVAIGAVGMRRRR